MLIAWAQRQNLLQSKLDRTAHMTHACTVQWLWWGAGLHDFKLIVIDSRPTLSTCQSIQLNMADIQHTGYQPCLVHRPKTWSIKLVASTERSTCTSQATVCWWMQLDGYKSMHNSRCMACTATQSMLQTIWVSGHLISDTSILLFRLVTASKWKSLA